MSSRAPLLIVTLFLGALSVPAWAQTPAWTISESSGQVAVLHGGLSKAAMTGAQVDVGDIVSTGRDGRLVLVRGEDYMTVSPGSRFRIAEPETKGSLTRILEEAGNILFKIKKMAAPHFGVETPYLAAVVKGTTFSVTVTQEGAAVQVTEGAVQVSALDGGATQLVTHGMIGLVTRGDPASLRVDGANGDDGGVLPEQVDKPATSADLNASGEPAGAAGVDATPAITTAEAGGRDVSVGEGRIGRAIGAHAGSIAALSGGLVSGDASAIASAASAPGTAASYVASYRSDSAGNGNASAGGNANANATAGGSANAAAGGNANVTSGGSGNIAAGGNANAASGGSANAASGGSANVAAGGSANAASGGSANVAAGGNANVAAGGNANVAAGGNANVASGGSANVAAGGSANAASGGGANVASGGSANVAAGGSANVAAGGSTSVAGGSVSIETSTAISNAIANLGSGGGNTANRNAGGR